MSGGPAADLASNHPNVNLVIDQSYSDFDNIIKTHINIFIEDFIRDNSAKDSVKIRLLVWAAKYGSFIITAAIKFATPAWKTHHKIRKIKGHIALLFSRGDSLINMQADIQKNFSSAYYANDTKKNNIRALSIQGEHGDSWVSSCFTPKAVYKETSNAIEIAKEYVNKIDMYYTKNFRNNVRFQGDFDSLWNTMSFFSDLSISLTMDLREKCEYRMFPKYLSMMAEQEKKGALISVALLQQIRNELLSDAELLKSNVCISDDDKTFMNLFLEKVIPQNMLFSAKYSIDNQPAAEDVAGARELDDLVDKSTSILLDMYKLIITEIDQKNLSKQQLVALINQKTGELPIDMREPFEKFICQCFYIDPKALHDASLVYQVCYDGRKQMDRYLREAQLMGSFII